MTRYVLRPLWAIGLAWLITLLICPWLPTEWHTTAMIACAGVFVISLCIPACRRIHVIPLTAVACLLAILAYHGVYLQRVKSTEVTAEQSLLLDVQVVGNDPDVLLQVQSGDLPRGTKIVWYSPDAELAPELYDQFSAVFTVEPIASDSVLSQLMRRANGVWLRVHTVQINAVRETLTAGPVPWTACFSQARKKLVTAIEQHLDGDVGAAVAGICYGADEHLSDEAALDFRRCGVSHLFAVSGLHMTVLLQGFVYLLRRLRVGRVWRSLLGMVLVVAFMAIVGFSASVVRAGVVSVIALLGSCLRRCADARNSLGLALIILLIADPLAVYDAGLLLSFAATFGLLCWTDPIQQFFLRDREPKHCARLIKAIVATASVSLSALFATLPVLALYFGQVSLLSVPANLLTTLSAEAVLITGCLGSLVSVCRITVVAQPLFFVAGVMSRYLLWICEKISDFSLATVAIRAPFLLLWLIGIYFLFLLGRRVLGRQGLSVLCGVCVCILCVGILLHRGTVYNTLRTKSVNGTGGLSVVATYRGSTVLVTAPDSISPLYDARDALDALGSSRVDAVFVIGGEESAVAYIPAVLQDYLTDSTPILHNDLLQDGISLSRYRVKLGKSLDVQWQQDELFFNWHEKTLLFTTKAEATVKADAVFCGG